MSRLAELLRSREPPAANPANPANPDGGISNISNISRGVESTTHFERGVEARADAVLQRLETCPHVERAFLATPQEDGSYLVTVAVRGVAAGELTIPAERLSNTKDLAAFFECMEARQ